MIVISAIYIAEGRDDSSAEDGLNISDQRIDILHASMQLIEMVCPRKTHDKTGGEVGTAVEKR